MKHQDTADKSTEELPTSLYRDVEDQMMLVSRIEEAGLVQQQG